MDDEKAFLDLAKTILSDEGPFNIETATSVDTAFTKLQNNNFDIIISDYDMPQKNGLDFLKLLREKGYATPFILFTGKGREEIVVQALNMGVDRYISKHGEPKTVYTELSVCIRQLHEKIMAQKLLWESEERFKQMVTNSKDLIMLTGANGVIIYLSPSCKDILGYEPIELIGKIPWITHPDDLERVQKIFQLALTTQLNDSAEYRIVTKRGETKWVNHSFSQIIENGKIKQIVSTVKDITEAKIAQAKLIESEERFRLVVENSPIMMANLNRNLQYTWIHNPLINPLSSENVLGKHFGEAVDMDDCEEIREALHELIVTGGSIRREATIHINKETCFLECYFEAAKNQKGEVTGIRYTAYDVTQRRQMAAQLKSLEERWNFALEGAGQGVWDFNVQTNSVFLSRKWKKILDYEEHEFTNDFKEWQNRLHPEDKESAIEDIMNYCAGKTSSYVKEYRLLAKDGTYKWIFSQGNIMARTTNGKPSRVIGTIMDITKHKQSENAIKESEAKFSAAFNSSGAAMTITRLEDGLILEVNDCFLETFGYTREEVIGKTAQMLHLYADMNERQKIVELTLKSNSVVNREVKGLKKDKTEVTALFSTKMVYLKGQKNLVTTLIDISSLKKIENSLYLRQKELENLIAMAPDSVTVIDLEGKIIECNELSCKTFGYTREEMIGSYGANFVVERDRNTLENEMRNAVCDKQVHTSIFTGKCRNGNEIAVEGSVKATFDNNGSPTGFIAIIRDITERNLAERKLQESEERYRFMAEHAQDIITVTDVRGNFLFVSPSIKRLAGFTPDELKGKKGMLTCIHVDDLPLLTSKIQEAMTNNVAQVEVRFLTKCGSFIWLETNISTVKDTAGETRFISISRDMTQRRIDREERDQALAKAELLLEKLSVVGGFVRHDVRNKLAAITSTLYLSKKYANDNQNMLKQVEQIGYAADNIEHILEFAQTYEAVGSRGLSWCAINRAIEEAKNLSPDLNNIQIETENVNFEALADSALTEIFHNLIDNSIKYGKNLTLIRIFSQKNDKGNIDLIYEDNGVGIDPQIKPRLFQKGAGKGTGLGVYLIQQICYIYGWRVFENGEQGKGVRFIIEIPQERTRKL